MTDTLPPKKSLIDPPRLRYRANKQLEAPLGTRFLSAGGQRTWDAYLRVAVHDTVPDLKTAVVAHVFYPDLLDEVLQCWRTIPLAADLHITTIEDHAAEIATRTAKEKHVHIHVHPNRGRDIAPFMALLNEGMLAGYDAVLKIHTKRSPQQRNGNLRRQLLFAHLAGHRLQIIRILRQFEKPQTGALAGPEVGMVGWGLNFRRDSLYWYSNQARVQALCDRMQIASRPLPCFFEGSMFWFRPAAIASLRRLQLVATDFEPESGQLEGALHHALERTFTLAALSEGYTITAATGRELAAP